MISEEREVSKIEEKKIVKSKAIWYFGLSIHLQCVFLNGKTSNNTFQYLIIFNLLLFAMFFLKCVNGCVLVLSLLLQEIVTRGVPTATRMRN